MNPKKETLAKNKKLVEHVILATKISVFADNVGHSEKGDFIEFTLYLGGLAARDSNLEFWIAGTGLEFKNEGSNTIIKIPVKKRFTTFS